MADETIRSRRETFVWSDDEVDLLLRVTLEYKAKMVTEGIDWESVQNKYI